MNKLEFSYKLPDRLKLDKKLLPAKSPKNVDEEILEEFDRDEVDFEQYKDDDEEIQSIETLRKEETIKIKKALEEEPYS